MRVSAYKSRKLPTRRNCPIASPLPGSSSRHPERPRPRLRRAPGHVPTDAQRATVIEVAVRTAGGEVAGLIDPGTSRMVGHARVARGLGVDGPGRRRPPTAQPRAAVLHLRPGVGLAAQTFGIRLHGAVNRSSLAAACTGMRRDSLKMACAERPTSGGLCEMQPENQQFRSNYVHVD